MLALIVYVISISCFEEAKREMDTVDWHVYYTFCCDAELSIMLWGFFSVSGTGNLVKVEGSWREDYVKILKEDLKPGGVSDGHEVRQKSNCTHETRETDSSNTCYNTFVDVEW